jgi:hypothetical protein
MAKFLREHHNSNFVEKYLTINIPYAVNEIGGGNYSEDQEAA